MSKNLELKISFIILTFNEEQNIGTIIEKIEEIIKIKSYEILIIDSESSDNTIKIVKKKAKKFKNIRYFLIKKSTFNFGKTRNLAIKLAKGKYVCFISADAKIINVDIKLVEKLFKKDRRIVAVYGKQIPREDCNFFYKTEIECRFEKLEKYIKKNNSYLIQSKSYLDSYIKNNDLHSLYFLSNVFCFYRKSFLLQHKFEEQGSEDLLMGKKIINLGYKKVFDPKQVVIHSHNFNLKAYIKRQVEEYSIVFDRLRIKKKPLILCKIKRIIYSKEIFLKKLKYLSEFIFFYFVKILVFLIIKLYKR